MKIEVLQENLLRALVGVVRFVESKPTLPVMSMVKVEAGKKGVSVVASNLETSIRVELGAKVNQEGVAVVPAKLLYEYVNSLSPGKMELVVEGTTLQIQSGANRASFEGMDPGEFPTLPVVGKGRKLIVSALELDRIVRLVGMAAASEPIRPVLASVMFEVKSKGKMRVVATDGYRLSLLDKVEVEGELEKTKLLVPVRVLVEVARLMKESEEEKVEMVLEDKKGSVLLKMGKTEVVAQLVEGDFPAFERILPSTAAVVVRIGKEELRDVVKLASVFARDNAHIVRWRIEEGKLTVESAAVSVGEQKSTVAVEIVEGDKGEIAFNGKFLLDLLGNMAGEEVKFSMNGELEPGVFAGSDKGFTHVIMPVRTQEG